jgi:hypothetical protein
MKRFLIFLLLLVSGLSFSQEANKEKNDKNKNVDKNITHRMDSLSKKYKVKVIGAYKIRHDGVYVEGIVYEDKRGDVIRKETKRINVD